ncbi:MAG: trigger factor [Candidatus Vogelbacteria bacterium]|nr:trigger factor [Candidatus Vogelbacteria bacterium]
MIKLPKVDIQPAGEGELELTAELEVEIFNSYRDKALKALGDGAKIDGFRQGHIPEKVLIEKIGEEKVLWEMAQQAIADYYPAILQEHKIPALGQPEVTITKIAKDNPLGFKVKTAVMPEIKIGDYKKIAKELGGETSKSPEVSPPSSVNDEEITKVLEELRRSRATVDHSYHEHKEGEECKHDDLKDGALPELNDEFAQSLGEFKTLDELKAKIKENLELEKKHKAKDKKRVEIIEAIIKASDIKIASLLIESEKEKMLAEMESQIGYMGLKFDEYLTHLKKTREELKGSWDKEARQRVAFGLILANIASLEKIEAPEEDLRREVDYLKNQYKDVPEDRLRSYASSLIVNEKVFEYLEGIK